ncbi:SIMPL domain-containing protein [Acuticoccus sp. M5D2P5]|uniref:SIMPL domain-containing protein n=1 Tax=Acuticoccus kalidii TaxID=2910977 RepID=UPI001F1AC655|nr:SIMPL domain-containing protein [Acuticoccus kalidii]MCF3932752.1 SIMPL domain-containing protein [Acuticoccus kalidii]
MFRVAAAALIVVFALTPANADEMRQLTVTGEGTASAAPDVATITIGVETVAPTAAEAMANNNTETQAVLDTIGETGIEARDIQTSDISVQPRYTDRASADGGSEVSGYAVVNQVNVKVRDLDGLGALLDKVVGSGANRIFGISFGFADDTDVTDEARRAAVEDAKRKGQLFAEATGVTLGDIAVVTEGGFGGGPRPFAANRMASSVPVATGEQSVSATVMITWTIAD